MAFDPNNPTASGMVLTFDDEFTTSSISSDGVANGTKWNDHIWFHAPAPGDFNVASGVMNVLGDPNDPWAANMMTTNSAGQGFAEKYGYFEADIKVPGGQGTWPSFWGFNLASIQGQPVPASEFDIMEGQGSAPTYYWSTLHQATNNSGGMTDATNSNATINSGVTLSAGFHRFGMLWDPNSSYVTFYFDGQPTIQVPKWSTTDSSAISLILGSGIGDMIGTNQPGPTTPNPADMQVDYVRVYQFASLNPTAVQPDPVSTAVGNTNPVALVNALGQGSGSTGGGGSSSGNPLTLQVSADLYNGDPSITVLVDGTNEGSFQVSAHHSLGQVQTIRIAGNFDPSVAHQVQVQFTNDAWDGTPNIDGHDRDVYIESVSLNAQTIAGENFTSNNASLGEDSLDPNAAVMLANGTVVYDIAASPPSIQAATPVLSVQAANGNEGGSIPLSIAAAQAASNLSLADLTVRVSGLGGSSLNHGTHNADGSYTLQASDLTGLALLPAAEFTGALALSVTATDTEPSTNTTASTTAQTLNVTVNPVAEAPTLGVTNAGGTAGTAIPLVISAAQTESDLALADLTIAISGLQGAVLNHGTLNSNGYTLHAADLQGLSLTPAAGFSGTLALGVTATDTEPSSGTGASTQVQTLDVFVSPPQSGGNSLTLHVSGDQWNGDPEFIVLVDGKQVGGIYDASASHDAGQWQDITVTGTFAQPHQVGVAFINDAFQSGVGDRNLYVASITVDGHTYLGNDAVNGGSAGFASTDPTAAELYSNGTLQFDTASPLDTASEPRTSVYPSNGVANGTAANENIYATGSGQTLIGGGGDDIFQIGSHTDAKITETAPGVSEVVTSASRYTLPDGINNLMGQGKSGQVLTGNSGDNVIYGTNANDTLIGGDGNDKLAVGTGANTLTGGHGDDSFVFSSFNDHNNVITDFNPSVDLLDLRPMFTSTGYTGSDPQADGHINLASDGHGGTIVSIDPDGSIGAKQPHVLVTLQNILPTLVHPGGDLLWH